MSRFLHGLDHALGLKETRMAITAFIYGCIGLTFGALLIYYIMIYGVGKGWPLNIGGKPNFTFYHNMQLLFQSCLSVLYCLPHT